MDISENTCVGLHLQDHSHRLSHRADLNLTSVATVAKQLASIQSTRLLHTVIKAN